MIDKTIKSISDMTPEERLTAAAVIMRDGVEEMLAERTAQASSAVPLAVAS